MTLLQKEHLIILVASIDRNIQIALEAVIDLIHVVGVKLSDRIDSVCEELVSHRNNTEFHLAQVEHPLKRIK